MKKADSERPKVLVLTSTFPRWKNDPEPAFVFELSRRLTDSFDVTALAPRSPGSKENESMAGLRVIRYPYFIRKWENLATHSGGMLNKLKINPFNYLLVPFFLAGQLLAIIRLLKNERFDLIHAHWIIPQGIVAVIARILTLRRIPLVCTSHGADLFDLRGKLFQRLKRWVMERSAALTVVSKAMHRMVLDMGIAPEKVRVISMGVDLKQLFIPDSRVVRNGDELLFVGRMVEKKGLSILLKAMLKVLDRYPNVKLTVAGSGPLETRLQEQCYTLGISENVDFLGMVTQAELPGLYQRATMAVFPFIRAESGDQEGFGLVVVEAMGCGCPVIASDLPAIHDSITHGENGLITPSGDSSNLADTILRVLKYEDLRFRLVREACKNVVGKFDWSVVAEKYRGLFDKLIRETAPIRHSIRSKEEIRN